MPYIRKKTKIILKDVYIYVKINGKEIGTKMRKLEQTLNTWTLHEF